MKKLQNEHYRAKFLLSIKAGQHGNRVSFSDFDAHHGECWHILGQNGSGKSSFLLVLAGLLGEHEVRYFDKAIQSLPIGLQAKTRCFLHQQQRSEFDIPLRQLLEFYTQHKNVPALLDTYLHVNSLLDKPLSKLSGGQQQRFHIARCLVQVFPALEQGQAILILDEPIAQLDIKYQIKVLDLLRMLCERGNLAVMSCHDINHSIEYATHSLLLKSNSLYKQGESAETLSQDNLESVFEHSFTPTQVKGRQKNFLIS